MAILEPVILTPPEDDAITRAELDAMPDDGRRHELLDGALIVTPAPAWMHQRVQMNLIRQLLANCPDDLEVLAAPFDVALTDSTVLQPDVVIARRSDYTPRGLQNKVPLLAVEVLSPSTRGIDLLLKRSRFEEAGCPSYWVVDPDDPSIIGWDLRDGVYAEIGKASGEDVFSADLPFAVEVVPAELVR
jgi:Uma2 family endonuclease